MPGQVSRAVGTALERSTIQNWDCAKGLLTDSTDPNGVTTHTTYDPIGRVVQTVEGGTRTTNIRYNEASVPVNVTTSRTVNTADDNFQIRRLDQRGHVYQTQANDIYVDLLPRLAVAADGKSYEAVSNAHRTSGNGSDGWTRHNNVRTI